MSNRVRYVKSGKMQNKIKAIAIYLPQFHPIPENDNAWGEGFTEWTNVRKSLPLFKNHYQPHVPHHDIGYYDLRDVSVLEKQATLAQKYGIYGFMFYHYWFNGKRLLNTPIDYLLKSGKPDFPFCLTWANENWTRRWDGADNEIIIQQNYSLEDDQSHMHFLCTEVFTDKRYITVDGKPLFVIYKPELFPNIAESVKVFRTEAKKNGFDLYLCYFENRTRDMNPTIIGFDACLEFQPKWSLLPPRNKSNLILRALNKLKIYKTVNEANYITEFSNIVDVMTEDFNIPRDYKKFPTVVPMWDNSARRKGNATIFRNSTPELYGRWLKNAIDNFTPYSENENLLFINAWNEWAEGNHIEPCVKWGYQYLEMTRKILNSK